MKKIIVLGLAGFLVYWFFFKPTKAVSPDWTVGTWEKTYDPDNDPKETITFNKDGSLIGRVLTTGRSVQGAYKVSEPEKTIYMRLSVDGKLVPMGQMTYPDSKDKLFFTVEGKTSHYERLKS